jgi:3-methyladenine DNA glycosylase AlkC
MATPLKYMFSDELLLQLADQIAKEFKKFDKLKFLSNFKTKEWRNAELKTRVRMTSVAMHDCLPMSYSESLAVLIPVSKKIQSGFVNIIFPDYVEQFGMSDWKTSMHALSEFTQTSSSEFAIRPFLIQYPEKTMAQMMKWSKHANVHLRRLSSEGCRPRLPWGMKLDAFVKDPSYVILLLENLKRDPELYVRKSVANNLNDISKDHPDLVLKIAREWHGQDESTDWIVNHALRTLLKRGNKEALSIFGHHEAKGIEIEKIELNKKRLNIGDNLTFSFEIQNTLKRDQDVRIEYAIDYYKASGKTSRKVFHLSKTKLKPGILEFKRMQRFTDFTTRKHYPGIHRIHILVNGEIKASQEFKLI